MTPDEIYEEIADALHHLCKHEQEIIEVNVDAAQPLSVVRHWRDPEKIFDRSKDQPVVLEPALLSRIEKAAGELVRAFKDFKSGTVRVYMDGTWSYGGSGHIS